MKKLIKKIYSLFKKNKQEPPKKGDKIQITWLPNPKNAPNKPCCYIGYVGVVTEISKTGFTLKGETSILIISGEYIYKKL
jgi:hypothetical protein